MGVGVRAEAPDFVTSGFRVVSDTPAAWIEQEKDFDTAPRYILSLFVPDQVGLLLRVLAAVDDGLTIPISGSSLDALTEQQRRVKFSIDGMLASSLQGAFVVATVLKASAARALIDEHPDLDAAIEIGLREQIANCLDGLGLPDNLIGNIDVHRLASARNRLFESRRFAEFRFGALADTAGRLSLAKMVIDFARDIGRHGIPIAYLYFPDDDDRGQGLEWVRIGIGAPARAVDMMEADLRAVELARRHNCVYAKYNPVRGGESLDDRFSLIADFAGPRSPVRITASEDEPVDVVFAQGPARPGFVADMLQGKAARDVQAGSMTVLAGHTIACWVVKSGQGGNFATEVAQISRAADGDQSGLHVHGPLRLPSQRPVVAGKAYWVAWRSPDCPGVARRVVQEITGYVEDSLQSHPHYTYAISRVLAEGEACAGKVRFRTPEHVSLEGFSLERLHERVKNALAVMGHPVSDYDVRVQEAEPGEEPWASLLYQRG